MRQIKILAVLVMVLMLVACAGIQEKWATLTPDEKARIIINDIQGQLDNAFNQGKAFVVARPEYIPKWKAEVIPAMDTANKALASVIVIGKMSPLTPEFVYTQVQAQVTNVLNLLIQMGAIKK